MEDYVPLSKDWLTEGTIDLEYKSYLLLAYLKKVEKKFSKIELYPPLKDVISQYDNLVRIREGQEVILEKSQKDPIMIDLEKLKIIYKENPEFDKVMGEIQKILDFSIPKIQNSIETGKSIYEEIERQVKIEPIGIIPIEQGKGFIFTKAKDPGFIDVFQFRIQKMELNGNPIKGIYTDFLRTIKKGFSTLESIKTKLMTQYQGMVNPMTYFVSTGYYIPRDSTLMPIAKRKILASVKL